MQTMGLSDLRIVAAPGIADDEHAMAVAHGATTVLANARYRATLRHALADRDLVVGTTARARGHLSRPVPASRLAQFLRARGGRVAIVFGSEESGLSNAELAECQVVSSIPMHRGYPSLNLGQAVMVYCYELRALRFQPRPRGEERDESDLSARRALADRLPGALARLGLDRSGALYARLIERALHADDADTRLIHSVVNAILKAHIRPPDR